MKKKYLSFILVLIAINISAQIPQKKLSIIHNTKEIETISDTIENLIILNYIYADKGKMISEKFSEWSHKNFTKFPISYSEFAKEASVFLKEISDDKHFFIQAPKNKKSIGALEASNKWFLGPEKGYGFTKYELLKGNVAYVKYAFFNFMMMPDAKATIDRVIAQLNMSDAIIIDLRGNPGGDSEMADYMFSYFMPKDSLYLSSFTQRQRNGELEYSEGFTNSNLPEKRIENKPIFILVNEKTGSSAEYFAFLAKNHTDATIIGQQTAGAGHSLTVLKVNQYLTIGVPSGRLYNKSTNKGWEETNGIIPDIIIEEDTIIEQTHSLALKAIEKIKQ